MNNIENFKDLLERQPSVGYGIDIPQLSRNESSSSGNFSHSSDSLGETIDTVANVVAFIIDLATSFM